MEEFFKKIANSWIARIVGVLFLGVISSGIWDLFGRSSFNFVVKLLVAALGYFNIIFVDYMYIKAARGFREEFTLIFASLITAMLILSILKTRRNLKKIKIDQLQTDKINTPNAMKRLKNAGTALQVLGLFLVLQFFQVIFVNMIITNFKQVSAICAPYITEHERLLFDSRFAQMKNKEDFEKILSDLKQVAQTNRLVLPLDDESIFFK